MVKQKSYGIIHCHSDNSLKDSALKINELVQGACDMGAKAITLTDHGTCTGIFEFMKICTKKGIKPIPGVEAYVETKYNRKGHLVLLAKNYKGYQEICRAVTMANKNIEQIAGVDYPKMTKKTLDECFLSGNVIATSACVSGVLASIILYNKNLEKEIDKLKKKSSSYSNPKDPGYLTNKESVEKADEKIQKLIFERSIVESVAKKSYKKRLTGLKSLQDSEVYLETKEKLEAEIAESERAKEKLQIIKKELESTRKRRTLINNRCREAEKTHQKYTDVYDEIRRLEEELLTEDEMHSILRSEIIWYRDLFGDGNFYIELQYHGMADEKKVMDTLLPIAEELNIPLVAANDIHIRKKEDAPARQVMRSLRFKKYEEISDVDRELYMKSDEELSRMLSQIIPHEYVEKAMKNIQTVCDSCNVKFPKESHYPKYRDENGREVKDSAMLLRKAANDGIKRHFKDSEFDAVYKERLNYELDVIISLGYADYTLIVADYINYAQNLSIQLGGGAGYGVGPGRGSGAGSLVNYLLGITCIDPLKYALKFERYLNKDRVSMPDIDTDFSEEVRNRTIEYVSSKYGSDSVAGIRTLITQTGKLATNNAVRYLSWKTPELEDKYNTVKNQISSEIVSKLDDCIDDLKKKYNNKYTAAILDKAKLIEDTANSLGVHAAGIIIGDGKALSNYVPLMYNTKKKQWAVQCDMKESEAMGLLKMDFLGLNNLDIITECIRRIKKNTGKTIDPNSLPFEREVFEEIFSRGKTGCVFQFESPGMKKMLRDFQPESFEDIILLVAAYRPGPMDSIPAIIEAKHGRIQPVYEVEGMEEILAPTYGQPIYQEQLMDIFHKCAGFTMGEADIIRKHMSKKEEDLFLAYKPKFIKGIVETGCSNETALNLWESLVSFGKYAFNKSHAAAYSLISYITAYLKYFYPAEYMTSVLNHSKIKSLPAYLHECKIMEIEVVPPDINHSSEKFEDRDGKIICGLGTIKNVKNAAQGIISCRKDEGFYLSFADFMLRTNIDKKAIESLIKAGCFDKLIGERRTALVSKYDDYMKFSKGIQKKDEKINELSASLLFFTGPDNEKQRRRIRRQLSNANASSDELKINLKKLEDEISFLPLDNKTDILKDEKELLGAYVSGHPLEAYAGLYDREEITMIDDFEPGKICCAGLISNVRIVQRKKDGADMAFFTLEDLTGIIQVNCFVETYKKYKNLIAEDEVVKIYGSGIEEETFNDDGDGNVMYKLTARTIVVCKPQKSVFLISYANADIYYRYIRTQLSRYDEAGGHQVWLHNSETGEITETDVNVSDDILNAAIPKSCIRPLDF